MRRIRHFALLVLLWLLATGGVAWGVAFVAVRPKTEPMPTVPPIQITERDTARLEPHRIQPVVSVDSTVSRDGGAWVLSGTVSNADAAYRLLATPVGVLARIDGGPAGFACDWRGLGDSPGDGVHASCTIPTEVAVASGMSGTFVIQLESAQDVLSLPRTAVIGDNQLGQVLVVTNGQLELRNVELGRSDGFNIEITSGLQDGEEVLLYPTQSDVGRAIQP